MIMFANDNSDDDIYCFWRLTYDSIFIFLLKPGQGWEYEAQSGHYHKHTRHHCNHLQVQSISNKSRILQKNMFYFANTQGEQVTCVRWKSDSGGLLFGRKLTFEMPPKFQIPRVYVQIGFSHSIVGKGTCWPLQRWNSADFQRGSKVFFGWLRTCRLQTLLQRCLPRQQRYWISWY